MRGAIERREGGPVIALGPAWCRVALRDVTVVEVVLEPEGPQRADLAPDIAAALDAAPDAAAFFDSLAQFYRTAWLRWIDLTKRRPDQRPIRIAEMVFACCSRGTRNVPDGALRMQRAIRRTTVPASAVGD
jgi:hypothetical protein